MKTMICPECGSTAFKREEERVVQDTASIDTKSDDLFDYDDEETVATKGLTEWECWNGHRAPEEIAAELNAERGDI